MPTLYSIQYLRAFAALAVVVFHAGEKSGLHFTIGAAGVDVFFVVSGFIMMAISDARAASPGKFFRNRLMRIVPIYWAATLLMIAGAFAGAFPNLVLSLPHVLGSLLFLPVASPSTGALWPVLVQGWTLNYEIFFYAVFALTLFARPTARLPLLALVFGTLVALGLIMPPENPSLAFYTAPVVLEFVAGAALAKLWQRGTVPPARIGLALICLSIAGFAAIQIFKLEFDAWSCGPLAIMLVTGALSLEKSRSVPRIPALAYLGDASYSIYIWHTFAVSVAVKILSTTSLAPAAATTIAVVAGTLIGVLAYEALERPMQALVRGKRSGLWRFPAKQTERRPIP
jgi:exopolysaccharide production protein ExoZ